jgi:hypothetical protein
MIKTISDLGPQYSPQQVACPQCAAGWRFQRSSFAFVDCSGFESYELKCAECGAALIGVIDPRDDQLLLS